ncbi:DEAD/DEAH box helicase family protein [Methylobrevis sp. L22]|uniref:DEAD/DEAH box helicase family protein n=2 Tax=Methylobrevis albus TaxID=2793297 RepID=A0A931N031_9HYPH|nr:DEAD/DEAH box helicase family protein [Methylobrevis albus]
MVAFRGSPNDSERAFRNYESISVYYSWVDEREAARALEEKERFVRIWENRDPNLRVHTIPDAIRRDLVQLTTRLERPYRLPRDGRSYRWRHQGEAITAFLQAQRGVLEMATGTGKTRTALSIVEELRRRDAITGAIVCAYGTDLLDQWYRELLTRTDLPIYREYAEHREGLGYLNGDDASVLLISRQNLVNVLSKLPAQRQQKSLLICDEVHGMGSSAIVEALTARLDGFVYRLGLSATPERAYDAAGNDFVEANIGPVIYRFTLEQAILRGILCEFDYVDLEYEFSEDDKAAVRQAIRKHFARANGPDPQPQEQLFQELARIRKLSQQKLAPFRAYAADHVDILRRSLIFVETAEYGFLVQQILMDMGLDFHTYYGDDDRANLRRFADGELECLVTCKRISEGIDISSVGAIVLFASARSRLETVQRLGRCLRIDPADPEKRAAVVDFIRTDDLEESEINPETTADEDRRAWFQTLAQVRRAEEDLEI